MSRHNQNPKGMIVKRTHDGDVTKTEYAWAPSEGMGKHYHRSKKRGWYWFGRTNNPHGFGVSNNKKERKDTYAT